MVQPDRLNLRRHPLLYLANPDLHPLVKQREEEVRHLAQQLGVNEEEVKKGLPFGYNEEGDFLRRSLQRPTVLGSDDSGAIRGLSRLDRNGRILKDAYTLSGEFGRAADLGLIRFDQIQAIACNSIRYSFAEPGLKRQLVKEMWLEQEQVKYLLKEQIVKYLLNP